MNIRPAEPDPLRRLTAPGTDATPAQPALRRGADAAAAAVPAVPAAPADRAELSSAARALFEQLGAPSSAPISLSPERARAVLARLASGHYDSTDVLDQVARRLQAAFANSPTED